VIAGALQVTILAATVAGPLLLGAVGLLRSWGTAPTNSAVTWSPASRWRLGVSSALLFALAFNATFFVQELMLVLPKALTPGLVPTLYHNNHTWTGEHELASLLQGTGALATLIVGLAALSMLRWSTRRTISSQCFLIWLAYQGLYQSLAQVVVGSFNPQNDVGMAMAHLALAPKAKFAVAVVALSLFAPIASHLAGHLISMASPGGRARSSRDNTRDILYIATLPALAGTLLVLPFRVPRHWIEVALVPAIVTWIGVSWMQAGAWRVRPREFAGRREVSVSIPLVALVLLLLFFQGYLRTGVTIP
jgi:hypothetical protein